MYKELTRQIYCHFLQINIKNVRCQLNAEAGQVCRMECLGRHKNNLKLSEFCGFCGFCGFEIFTHFGGNKYQIYEDVGDRRYQKI